MSAANQSESKISVGRRKKHERYSDALSKQWFERRMGEKASEPVWEYLEREMREDTTKPYNEAVGHWLKVLHALRYKKYKDAKQDEKEIVDACGPIWYRHLSQEQQELLTELVDSIHQDIIEAMPRQTQITLTKLGINPKIRDKVVYAAMKTCAEDPGCFLWELYKKVYKKSPAIPQKSYDMNAQLIMSGLSFIDYEECIAELNRRTTPETQPSAVKEKVVEEKITPPSEPRGKCAVYAKELRPTNMHSNMKKFKVVKKQPAPFDYKLKPKDQETIQEGQRNEDFLTKRMERKAQEEVEPRHAENYKFWEAPFDLRHKDKYTAQRRILGRKPKVTHQAPYDNVQMQVVGISFVDGVPYYQIGSVVSVHTGYIPIHGGIWMVNGFPTPLIVDHVKEPPEPIDECDEMCDCMKWYPMIEKYLEKTKCTCGHYYDYGNTGKVTEKYFTPPTRDKPLCFDYYKIFNMDPTPDFIRTEVEAALRSRTPSKAASINMDAGKMALTETVNIMLSDLTDTPLIIPHLPDAQKLPGLIEWARERTQGEEPEEQLKQKKLKSLRTWDKIKNMNFKVPGKQITFTQDELKTMDWSKREAIMKTAKLVKDDFLNQNRRQILHMTRMFWSSMYYESARNKSFLNAYYSYLPAKMNDIYLLQPYDSNKVNNSVRKRHVCPP